MYPARTGWFIGILWLEALSGCGGDGGDGVVDPASNEPPQAEISAPANGSRVPLSLETVLTGEVSDTETAPGSLVVSWTSDVEGPLGQPVPDAEGHISQLHQFLVPVTQTLTLSVTDEAGDTRSTSITVTIDAPPTAEIEDVEPVQPSPGDEVTVTGQVSDGEDDARNLEILWTDDTGQVLGTDPASKNGNVELDTDALASGTRTVTLTVTDSVGQQTTATRKITVLGCEDADDDGSTACDEDCDDADPSIYPGAAELCDGIDQDCDAIVDEGYPDSDGDKIMDCVDVETCDGVDNDGDHQIDEGFPDTDGDGLPDCVDAETCDGIDNNGNGQVDEGQQDTDGDGVADCVDPCPGFGEVDGDVDGDGYCDEEDNCPAEANGSQADSDGDGFGDACDLEVCNGIDDNGDGEVDEGFDQDSDGYTSCGSGSEGDCDDGNPASYPGADEVCDGHDNNCDGVADGDAYEPNDTLDAAFYLGDLNGADEPNVYTLEGTIHTSGNSDFYKLLVQDDKALGGDEFRLDVVLSGIPDDANYDLYLYWDDPDDLYFTGIKQLKYSTNSGSQSEEVLVYGDSGPDNGGNYWIEVRGVSGSGCDAPYTITIQNEG